jgi:hypothetical protein
MSCGISWTAETPQTPEAVRRFSASPTESEAPGTEINGLYKEGFQVLGTSSFLKIFSY